MSRWVQNKKFNLNQDQENCSEIHRFLSIQLRKSFKMVDLSLMNF